MADDDAEIIHLPAPAAPAAPAPDDVVGVRYADIADLDARVTNAETAVADYRAALAHVAVALGVEVEGKTPAELVEKCTAVARGLKATQALVDSSAAQLQGLITAGDGPEVDLGGGRKMKRVGRRLPDVIADGIPGLRGKGYPAVTPPPRPGQRYPT